MSKHSFRQSSHVVASIAISDFKVKYNSSVLGYFWSLAKPLFLFSILYVIFSRFLRFGDGVEFYAIQLLAGILLWSFFSETTSLAMRSIVDKGNLLRKIHFPREVIVISSTVTLGLTFLLNFLTIFFFMVLSSVPFRPSALLIIPLFIELFVLTLGVAFILSTMYVKFRDIGHIWEIILQGLFYATPIIYPLGIIPDKLQPWLMLNPVAQIIQDTRHVLISDTAPTATQIIGTPWQFIPYLLVIVLFVVGVFFFRKNSPDFAENI